MSPFLADFVAKVVAHSVAINLRIRTRLMPLQKDAAWRAVIASKKFVAYERAVMRTFDMVLAYCRPGEGDPWKG
jgi:hypothetical protein